MTKQGLLIVLSGPSGVGKDTVLRRFLQRDARCVLSVSATTRPPREGEADGREYYFISRERFGELAARGEMLEYASYSDNLYGTPKSAVDSQLARGKNVILEIDVKGAMCVRELRPDAVLVFLAPPDWQTLRKRLEGRGTETAESLEQRLVLARGEMSSAGEYDYILINNDVDACCDNLSAVVTAAGYSARHMKEYIEEVLSHA